MLQNNLLKPSFRYSCSGLVFPDCRIFIENVLKLKFSRDRWENDIVSLKTKRAVDVIVDGPGVARQGLALALFVALPKNQG